MQIYPDRTFSEPSRPDLEFIEKLFSQSSPQYLLEPKRRLFPNETRGAYLSSEHSKHIDIPLDKIYIKIKQFEEKQDPIRMLEYALPHLLNEEKNLRLLKSTALAYKMLGLLKPADQVLTRAKTLLALEEKIDIDVLVMEAENAAERKQWDEVIALYRAAEKIEGFPLAKAYYGQGVAHYMKGEPYAARSRFRKVDWVRAEPAMQKSAREFIVEITNQHAFGAKGELALGHDSNAYNWSGSLEFPEAVYGKNTGYFYYGRGQLYYRGYEDARGRFYLRFDGARKGFLDSSMAGVSLIDQRLSAEFALDFGGDIPQETLFGISFEPMCGYL